MKYQLSDFFLSDSKVFALMSKWKHFFHFLISHQLNIMSETNHSFASDLLENCFVKILYVGSV